MEQAILYVRNLNRHFGGLRALVNVTFSIDAGELVGIVGPNGAGKTTWFNVITGFIKPTSGEVLYKGAEISRLAPHQIAGRGVVRSFQKTSLFPNLSVIENTMIGLHRMIERKLLSALTQAILHIGGHRKKEAKARDRAVEILDFWGLASKRDMPAKNIPLVDQRRLEIAIATAAEPELLLLDEPAAGMNPRQAEELADCIRSLRRRGITTLVIEHNMRFVMGLCEHIIVLDHGAKISEGSPSEIRSDARVIRAYLGSWKGDA